MFTVVLDLSVLEKQIDGINDRVKKNLRKAVYKGAVTIRDEAIKRAGVSKKTHKFRSGRRDTATGKMVWDGRPYEYNPHDLQKSIYIAFANDKSIENVRVEYDVSFRKHTPYNTPNHSVPYAYWQELGRATEYGGKKTIAHPFLRPAFYAKIGTAKQIIFREIQKAINDEK